MYPALLHGEPGIRPEAETEIETGFDATFFKSRAQFTFTVYQKRIQDLLLQANVAPSLGFNQQWFNGGEFTNQGIEISLLRDADPAPQRLHLEHDGDVLPELQRRERASGPVLHHW